MSCRHENRCLLLVKIAALVVLLLAITCASATDDDDQSCLNISLTQREPIILDHIDVAFNGGVSRHHAFVINVCSRTFAVPTGRTRSVVSSPSMNCSASYVTQFGPLRTHVQCEASFDTIRRPCAWVAPTANATPAGQFPVTHLSCAFGSSLDATRMAEVRVTCPDAVTNSDGTSGVATVEAQFGPDGTIVQTFLLTHSLACNASATAPHTYVADIVLGVVIGGLVIAFSYSVAHNYALGYRGWQMLPWVRVSKRSAPSPEYVAVSPQDASEVADNTVQDGETTT